MAADTDRQSFWDHLDVLRAAVVRSLLVVVVFGVAAFCFKEECDKRVIPFTVVGDRTILYPESELHEMLMRNYRPGKNA